MRDAAYKSVIQSRNSLLRKKVKSMEFVACYFSLGHAHTICDSFNHNPGNKVNLNFGPIYSSWLVEI